MNAAEESPLTTFVAAAASVAVAAPVVAVAVAVLVEPLGSCSSVRDLCGRGVGGRRCGGREIGCGGC